MSVTSYSEVLKREDCILLLVDIQKVLLDPCKSPDLLLKNAAFLLDAAKLFALPVYLTVQNSDKLGGFTSQLLPKVPEPSIFNKVEFSCLENEAIHRALLSTNRRTLILAGIEAHVCIFQTGAHALRLGYQVHVISDAVSSRKDNDKETGLRRLEKAGAIISTTEMVIFELLQKADTDEFRAVLPLLRTL